MNPSAFNEQDTRYNLVDPEIQKAGWNVADRSQIAFEVPVQGYDASPQSGITDYCLYNSKGEVLAVIEAKRTRRNAKEGKEQVLKYVTEIEKKQNFRPFAFMTNGDDVWFWDSEEAAERHVAGFFKREDLERLLYLKQNRLPLSSIKIKDSIVNRGYQHEAIRSIGELFEKKKKRRALLVMATGTGKTRTTMALIDVFLRARQAQRILFVADRDSLVEQALTDGIKIHLPNESKERLYSDMLLDEKEKTKIRGARILVCTLQTMANCYERFSPSEFDLIVSDECHRSIYNKFSDVFAYFDAMQIGLTATPAHFIDRDTFSFFECDGTVPASLYTYDKAVKEGHLSDYSVYSAQTKFQRQGIKGVNLSEEEQNSLRERGIDPEDLKFEGTELEKKVTNTSTLVSQWEEFMDVCYKDSSGQLPAKTIVFAITKAHAFRLENTFNKMYPEYKGKLCRVIAHGVEKAKDLIDQFKKLDEIRIAISVDMLDTGVDLPEIMNLAFMKPVGSQIKFWQMIGRGTRNFEACRPEHYSWLPQEVLDAKEKKNFLIVDFWENFEHFNMMPKDDEMVKQVPVLVTIFNTRLKKIELLQARPAVDLFTEDKTKAGQEKHDAIQHIIEELRQMIARIPLSTYTVKKEYKNVRDAWEDEYWKFLDGKKIEFLRLRVAPLLRFVPDVSLPEAFFTSKMERLSLMLLEKQDTTAIRESIQNDISLLQTHLQQAKHAAELKEKMLSAQWWQNASLKTIDDAKTTLAPLMKYRREVTGEPLELDLEDLIESRKWVILRKDGKEGSNTQRIMVEEYRKKVEEKIEQLAAGHTTIQRLQKGEDVSFEELLKLEHTLEKELGNNEIALTEDNMLKAFGLRAGSLVDFLKHILKLEKIASYQDVVRKSFDGFIGRHNYNADQIRFLRTVQNVFVQKRKLEEADLYEAPFTNFGMNAVEKLFSEEEIRELVELTRKLVA